MMSVATQSVQALLISAENRLHSQDAERATALAAQAAQLAGERGDNEGTTQSLLLLHKIRRMIGDERQATLLALYALRVARNAGLHELAEQAQAALLNHYALAFSVWPMDQMLHELQQAG